MKDKNDPMRGKWLEQKMIPINGKLYGPYWYLRWRDGQRTRSRYLGKQHPAMMQDAP